MKKTIINGSKVCFSDLDGTLLNDIKQISNKNIAAIRNWQRNGNCFVISSGRHLADIHKLLTTYDLNLPIIALNGAVIVDADEKVISRHPIIRNLDILREVQEFCEHNHMVYIAYELEDSYARQYDDMINTLLSLASASTTNLTQRIAKSQFYFDQFYLKSHPLRRKYLISKKQEILKFEIFSEDSKKLTEISSACKNKFEVSSSSPRNIEITAKNVNKGRAVQEYLYQHSFIKSYAFGDGQNDLSMFSSVDVAISMNNASATVKEEAKYIISSNNDNGIEISLNKFCS